MHKHLLLDFFGILACYVANTVCSKAIIGGYTARANQFPYTASLQLVPGVNDCTASIIDDNFALTAAHCLVGPHGNIHSRSIFIVAGTNDLRRTSEPAVTISVKMAYIPTAFVYGLDDSTSDIAVLKLNSTLKLARNRYLKKLKRPNNQHNSLYIGEETIVTGFGFDAFKTADDGKDNFYSSEPRLRYAEAIGINNSECEHYYPHAISQKHLCARIKQHYLAPGRVEPPALRRGVCIKDSGAPLVNNGMIIIGVLSRGNSKCSDRKKPGLYTRVSHFLTFIRNAMTNKTNRFTRSYEYY